MGVAMNLNPQLIKNAQMLRQPAREIAVERDFRPELFRAPETCEAQEPQDVYLPRDPSQDSLQEPVYRV